jgi:diguanylate cyclase (GGDEF)-like protein
VLLTVIDVTDDRELVATLRHAATHDPLTGAVNRSAFLDASRHALARLRRHPGFVGVLFIDLDGFKAVNDSHGHGMGDHVLITHGNRLREALRPEDVLARLGGDEFAVLCEDLEHPRQLAAIARRAADRLGEPIMIEGGTITIAGSVGGVVTNTATAGAEHLIDVADGAMYRAKQRGGPPEVVIEAGVARAGSAADERPVEGVAP